MKQVKQKLPQFPHSLLNAPYIAGNLMSGEVFLLAQNGDELAEQITQRVLKSIQVSVVAILNLFNPQAIIFGGGVMTNGILLPDIKNYAYQYSLPPAAKALKEIGLSSLGPNVVGIMGASAVGWEDIKRKQ